MNRNDQFPIVLVGDVKSFGSNVNRLSEFYTELQTPIDLHGDYEVGITKCVFTKSWFNVEKAENLQLTSQLVHDMVAANMGDVPYDTIAPGHYNSIDELLAIINSTMSSYFPGSEGDIPKFYLDPSSQNIEISTRSIERLNSNLGFDASDLLNQLKESFTETVKGVIDGLKDFFVYTNIVKHTPVGDQLVRLLGHIDIPNETHFGESVTRVYSNPEFYPIDVNELKHIQIVIEDHEGRPVPFRFGNIVINLRVRKRKERPIWRKKNMKFRSVLSVT